MTEVKRGVALIAIAVALLGGCGSSVEHHGRRTTPDEATLAEQANDGASTADVNALFAMLDTMDGMGLPTYAGRQFVKVWTGREMDTGGDVVEDVQYGFLVSGGESEFVVLHLLEEVTYNHEWGNVRYEPADLSEAIDQELLAARAARQNQYRDAMMSYAYGTMSPRLRLVLYARAARLGGLDSKARELLNAAIEAPGLSMPLGSTGVVDEVRGDIALVLISQVLAQFSDESVTRQTLHEKLADIAARFPGTEAAIMADEYKTQLETAMQTPDAPVPDEGAPAEQQVPGLIRALNDYGTSTGYTYVQRLTALRHAAVPGLLAALDDQRLTRAAMGGSIVPSIGRVGDVCLWILREIAQRPFETPEQARTWWESVRGRSENELLLRDLREGGYEAMQSASRLLEIDAAVGIREVTAAARRATDPYLRARYVALLAQTPGDGQTAFLYEEAINANASLAVRIEAADGLQQRNDTRWVQPFFELVRSRLAELNQQSEDGYMIMRVLHMLVQYGGARGLELVEQASQAVDPQQRLYLIQAISTIDGADAETADRVNGLLVANMTDQQLTFDYGGYGPGACGAQRVGDVVAGMLAQRLGLQFDCTASSTERERARVALINRYREGRGEAPLPVPAAQATPTADASELSAARTALTAATTRDEIQAALARFTAIGLGAAAPLESAANALPPRHPARAEAIETARRLASTIQEFEITTEGGAELASHARFEAMRGQPLDGQAIVEALVDVVRSNRRGSATVEVSREAQGRGTTVRIHLTSNVPGYASMQSIYRWSIRRGQEVIAQNSGYSDPVRLFGQRPWRQLVTKLDEAMEAPLDASAEAYVLLEYGR